MTSLMKKKFHCYLRPHRRERGFTQKELAHLLGCKSDTVITRLENGQRKPSLRIALACYIIFGTPPHEMFPGVFSRIEKCILNRTWGLYENLQGSSSATTRVKLDTLEEAIERAKARSERSDV
jgi:transcriptional regulator with XRE-family HTH domain